ncbi:FCD domain-containing protein, partial [Achromobacter sp. Marseille-Q0513]|uniref:GntR family transcriptional regulator n=1 Tax=Achromobacter sp. Marseille-Q0513 TaxID=2829161 RepID=UPI001B9453DD
AAHRDAEPRLAAQRPGGYAAANIAFHDILYRASGNSYLIQQIMVIRKRTQPYRLRYFDQRSRLTCSWQEHAVILEAVLDGDENAASQAATSHIVQGGQQFREFAARFPSGLFAPVARMGEAEHATPALAWLYGPRTMPIKTNPVN